MTSEMLKNAWANIWSIFSTILTKNYEEFYEDLNVFTWRL